MSVDTATTASKAFDYLGTLRLLAGWLATPSLLVYATGGLAFGGARLNVLSNGNDSFCWWCSMPIVGQANASRLLVGWTAGAGIEWMLTSNVGLRAEYLRYDLGSVASLGMMPTVNAYSPFNIIAVTCLSSRTRFDGNLLRFGLNYHFGDSAAPPAASSGSALPVMAWTGFHGGLNAGYGFGDTRNVVTSAITAAQTNACFGGAAPCTPYNAAIALGANNSVAPSADGTVGGLQAGYNWMPTSRIVAGVEADVQGTGMKGLATGWSAVPVPVIGCFGGPGDACWIYTATKALDCVATLRASVG